MKGETFEFAIFENRNRNKRKNVFYGKRKVRTLIFSGYKARIAK